MTSESVPVRLTLRRGELASAVISDCNLAYAELSRPSLDGCAYWRRPHHALLHHATLRTANLSGAGLESIEGP